MSNPGLIFTYLKADIIFAAISEKEHSALAAKADIPRGGVRQKRRSNYLSWTIAVGKYGM